MIWLHKVKGSLQVLQYERVTSRTDINCEFPGTSPRVQLAPALPVPVASSLSLSLFLSGPAGSEFAPEKAKTGVQFKIKQASEV